MHFSVVKTFIARVRERAVGAEVSKALAPGQQVIKIVNEELINTLGEPAPLNLIGPKPRVIMLVGLQGSGKTTHAGKLARQLRSRGERVMLVAGDPYRPAAVNQLQQLGERLDVPVVADLNVKPPELAAKAFDQAEKGGYTAMIIDTAGRSQLDQALMDELKAITKKVGAEPPGRVTGGGVDTHLRGDAERFRSAAGVRDPYLLYIGRLDEGKNTHVAVSYGSAWARRRGDGERLVLLGRGPLAVPAGEPALAAAGVLDEQGKMDACAGALALCQPGE